MATFTLTPKAVNWLGDPCWIEVEETTLINGAGEPQQDNLSAYFEIKQGGQFLCEFMAPYDLATRKADLDLSGLAVCYPEPPADGSMVTASSGILDHPAVFINIEHKNMYGTPASKQAPGLSIGSYTMIYGSTPYWWGIGASGKDVLLHSYHTMDGFVAIKEIRKNQPEYIYIYSHNGASVTIDVELLYMDNTSDNVSLGTVAMGTRKVAWVNVGWNARSMDTHVDPAKDLNSYVVRVTLNGTVHTISYQLDDHDTEYDQYLMYENGIGGCEVIRCSGRHQIGVKGKKDEINYARVRGRSFREGFRLYENARGAEVWKMNTGYQNRHYIRHLQQLFLASHVWYIDMIRETFHSVTIMESEATLVDMQEDLQSFEFTMVFDDRPSLNTFNI